MAVEKNEAQSTDETMFASDMEGSPQTADSVSAAEPMTMPVNGTAAHDSSEAVSASHSDVQNAFATAAPSVASIAQPISTVAASATTGTASEEDMEYVDDDFDLPATLEPSESWPPPIFLQRRATARERYYIEHRWYSQWKWYDGKASESKRVYQRLQVVIGVGSVTVPVLVGFNVSNPEVQSVLTLLTVGISLAVAAAAAIENVKKYGDNWRSYRAAAEELKREKSLYDVRGGPYRRAKSPFLLFAERCEDIISKQNGQWLQLSEEKKEDRDGDGKPDRGGDTNMTTSSGYNTNTAPDTAYG